MQALDDHALVMAMRVEPADEWAWSEYMARARPVVEGFARHIRVPATEWAACVEELIEDVGMHLAHPKTVIPARLSGYLVTAAVMRRRQVARNGFRADGRSRAFLLAGAGYGGDAGEGTRRERESGRREERAEDSYVGRGTRRVGAAPCVVLALTSEFARRAATRDPNVAGADEADDVGPDVRDTGETDHAGDSDKSGGPAGGTPDSAVGRAVRRLVARLRAEFREDDLYLLIWHGAGITHRDSAEWLGIKPATASKRVARISARVEARAFALAAEFPDDERAALTALRRRGQGPGRPMTPGPHPEEIEQPAPGARPRSTKSTGRHGAHQHTANGTP